MMKRVFIFMFVLFFIHYAEAQTKVKIKKKDFFTTEINFKEAWKEFKKGHRLFKENKKGSYQMAIDHLLKAYEYNPDYAPLNYELGICYLKISDEKNAVKYLSDAFDLDPNVAPDIHLFLGRAYHLNYQFDDAIDEYELYRESLDEKKLKKEGPIIKRYIDQAKYAKNAVEHPKNIIVTNLGSNVNSKWPEYAPVFAPYDSIVFFTSRRPNTTGGKRNYKISNEYYEDIYYTSAKNGVWQPPAQFPKPVNSNKNDASVGVNKQGTILVIYKGKNLGGLYLSMYDKMDEKWTRPKPVIRRINKKNAQESFLTFSHDSTTAYFVSTRKGGYGGKDIWYIKRKGLSNSGWAKPINIGKPINTPYNEESVFLLEDDKTLYFASDGLEGMGGYDIYKTVKLPDGRWSKPENLGYPINTPGDDLFFFMNSDHRTGYFTSNGQKDNYGDFDIYEFFYYTPKEPMGDNSPDDLIAYIKEPVNELLLEDPVMIKTMKLVMLKGQIYEWESHKPIAGTVDVIDELSKEVIQQVNANSNGEYTTTIQPGKAYTLIAHAKGYAKKKDYVSLPKNTDSTEVIRDFELLPINPGARAKLRVYFETAKATLKPESFPELDRFAQIMKVYKGLVVEIEGHTDSRGSDAYNMRLSQARAEAVRDYLISKGVEPDRLIARGYGETRPIVPNDTPEHMAMNRRVEAHILENRMSQEDDY